MGGFDWSIGNGSGVVGNVRSASRTGGVCSWSTKRLHPTAEAHSQSASADKGRCESQGPLAPRFSPVLGPLLLDDAGISVLVSFGAVISVSSSRVLPPSLPVRSIADLLITALVTSPPPSTNHSAMREWEYGLMDPRRHIGGMSWCGPRRERRRGISSSPSGQIH